MNSEELNQQRTYAWNMFSLYTNQRFKLFQTFLALTVSIIVFMKFSAGNVFYLMLLSFVESYLAYLFWKLDGRMEDLIGHAKNALLEVEHLSELPEESPLGILTRGDEVTKVRVQAAKEDALVIGAYVPFTNGLNLIYGPLCFVSCIAGCYWCMKWIELQN